MSKDEVLHALMQLPLGEQAEVLDRAWQAIDDADAESRLDLEFEKELDARWAHYKAHPETAVPWDQVRREMKEAVDAVRADRHARSTG